MASHTAHLLLALAAIASQVCVSGLWEGSVLAAAVALGLRWLPGISAGARFAVWALAFTLVAALPFAPTLSSGPAQAPMEATVHASASWSVAIALLWALLMTARGGELWLQGLRLRQVWRRAEPIAVDDSVRILLQGSARKATLCVSDDVDSPGVIGFFSPRLLVPRALHALLTPDQLRQVVLHECEHLRRRDDWLNLLQKLVLVVFPLNIALLWVDRRLAFEREIACDERVIASTAAPLAYARCLTELAEHRLGCRRLALLLPAWGRPSELARRVHRLLRPVQGSSPLRTRTAVSLLCGCIAVTALALARVPRLVSFTTQPARDSVALAQQPSRLNVLAGVRQGSVAGVPASLVRAEMVSALMPRTVGAPGHKTTRVSRSRSAVHSRPRFVSPPVLSSAVARQPYERVADTPAATFTEISMPYAAVRLEDGWLIFQL